MSNTELRQAVAMKLHATQCGCSDYVGVGDEDSTYEEMVDALLPLFAEIRTAALEEAAELLRREAHRVAQLKILKPDYRQALVDTFNEASRVVTRAAKDGAQ